MDRLQSMEIFLKVVHLGSLSAAAEELSLSKSTVSKHLSELEERLGARLLNRTTRRLSLTEPGEIYRERCARIIQEIEDTELSVSHYTGQPRGRLKVNAPMTFGILHVAPLVPAFHESYPEVEIDLTLNDRRVELVDEGYDLAIRIGKLDDSTLIAKKLATARFVCAASQAYLERRRPIAVPADLSGHDCLRYSYSRNPSEWQFLRDGRTEKVQVSGSFTANNGDALREAAIGGLGVTWQPAFILAEPLADGRLIPLLCDWQGPDIAIHAVFVPSRHISPKLRVFIDFLARHYRRAGLWSIVLPDGSS